VIILGAMRAAAVTVVGECRDVHGRLEATNGNPSLRIWVVGTKRILGVAGDEGAELLPSSLRELISFEATLYGDFRVCPVTLPKPAAMQLVCIKAGRRLVQERTMPDGSRTQRKLPDVPRGNEAPKCPEVAVQQ